MCSFLLHRHAPLLLHLREPRFACTLDLWSCAEPTTGVSPPRPSPLVTWFRKIIENTATLVPTVDLQWLKLANGNDLSAKGAESIGLYLLSKASIAAGDNYGLRLPTSGNTGMRISVSGWPFGGRGIR